MQSSKIQEIQTKYKSFTLKRVDMLKYFIYEMCVHNLKLFQQNMKKLCQILKIPQKSSVIPQKKVTLSIFSIQCAEGY